MTFSKIPHGCEYYEWFVNWHNEERSHGGIGFVTPGQRYRGEDKVMLANRKEVYGQAKLLYPERWNGPDTRKWEYVG